MRTWSKVIIAALASALAAVAVTAVAFNSVDAREIGRSDPKRAANYQLPWFNFSETYVEGVVLGAAMGSTRADAIKAAESANFKVETSSWGDNRAGQSDLYERLVLLATMLRQPYLNFTDTADVRRGMTLHFRGDRLTRVDVHYINTEAI